MTDKTEAVRLAKLYGIASLPDGYDRVRIYNRGPDSCEAIVTREEYEAAPEPTLAAGDSVVFECFTMFSEPEPRIYELDGDRIVSRGTTEGADSLIYDLVRDIEVRS